jgi:hypothetical protein
VPNKPFKEYDNFDEAAESAEATVNSPPISSPILPYKATGTSGLASLLRYLIEKQVVEEFNSPDQAEVLSPSGSRHQ